MEMNFSGGASARVAKLLDKNNILRISKDRISIGPAPKFYKDGRVGSKISVHIHIDKTKFLVQDAKTGKVIYCKGKCY
jgi:hypothetical protein